MLRAGNSGIRNMGVEHIGLSRVVSDVEQSRARGVQLPSSFFFLFDRSRSTRGNGFFSRLFSCVTALKHRTHDEGVSEIVLTKFCPPSHTDVLFSIPFPCCGCQSTIYTKRVLSNLWAKLQWWVI